MKVSVIVITENEELNIKDCLESAKWADEIIVVDSNSSDNTVNIAKGYTPKVFSVDISSVTEKRKLSIEKSSNDWILFLDADERISAELKEEISALTDTEPHGYFINRKNYCFGKWIKHSGIYPDFHIRLFDRRFSRVNDRIVHEGIVTEGETPKLTGHLVHYSFGDPAHMMNKINYYSTMEAAEHFEAGKKISKAGVFTHALSAFLRTYISKKGYKDKAEGFYISFSYAMVNFLAHLKLLKLQDKL